MILLYTLGMHTLRVLIYIISTSGAASSVVSFTRTVVPKELQGLLSSTYNVTRCRIYTRTRRDIVPLIHVLCGLCVPLEPCRRHKSRAFPQQRRLSQEPYPYRRRLRRTCAGLDGIIVCLDVHVQDFEGIIVFLPVGIRIPLHSGHNHPPRQAHRLRNWLNGRAR